MSPIQLGNSENSLESARDILLYKQQINENNKLIDALRRELNFKNKEINSLNEFGAKKDDNEFIKLLEDTKGFNECKFIFLTFSY